jgi:class 3 adenylate cyclase
VSASDQVTCTACGELTLATGRFCVHCAAPLQQICPSCGAPAVPGARFCSECAAPLTAAASAAPAVPVAERRLVSVLFADLVGFTTLSEHRDPEEVRELLSRYFDRCRTLIGRYGGTVEKFIGDAVMAVWGTPVAREDDPERAVRAALALTQMVTAMGEEVGMPDLRVRAGVMTGNAAVEVGAEGEGMVLGDTVNTASRLQSIAAPGTVLVDDVTRRASEAAITYEDAGVHEVKGREQPVNTWTALQVVAGAGGRRRSVGLEAPFVGRERELEAVVDAGEDSAHARRARHAAIVGEAGSGKSRLLWEFFKYLDGIEELRYWHQGRCLSYGEGVAYWALAEMVRARARIAEEEDPASAREKLRAAVEEFVPDERERRLVEPRLAHLLRLEERPDADRVDLFSGWRLFFERMAETHPVILAFEDLQWADSGLLDFIDYLLEWSAEFPVFVITLSRPELRERRAGWAALNLPPLEPAAIEQMLDVLAPGLPPELVEAIGHRAEGIPLYAVETIRMLQDRGVLVQEGARYTVAGDISDLEVPETLHALVASRLDGLPSAERSLLQDASVLGQSFTAAAAAALSELSEPEVGDVLDRLVTKQILARDDDPRSPERGQYLFLQGLLRTVAYGTLSRRARKARHVAAAEYLERTWPGEARDIAEVLASHYLEAIRAEPDAEDVSALRASARERLIAAGQAAASLVLGPEADRYLQEAAELADDDLERAELFEQAGRALWQSGDWTAGEQRLRDAIELFEREAETSGGSAVVTLASGLRLLGRLDEARVLLERFRSPDASGTHAVIRAEGLAELAAALVFAGAIEEAGPLLEQALSTLELEEATALANALVTRSVYLLLTHRFQEGDGVLRHALMLAEQLDVPSVALRARLNLAQVRLERDQLSEAVAEANEGLALARERGDRALERRFLTQLQAPLVMLGRWDELPSSGAAMLSGEIDAAAVMAAAVLSEPAAARGDEELLGRARALAEQRRESSYVDVRVCALTVLARDALEHGAADRAVALMQEAIANEGLSGDNVKVAYALGVDAAIALGDERAIMELETFVDAMQRARATPLLRAGRARLRAERLHRGGDEEATKRHEDEAIGLLRSVGARPQLARALLERSRRRDDPEALAEARAIYTELGATRWLARIDESSEVPA